MIFFVFLNGMAYHNGNGIIWNGSQVFTNHEKLFIDLSFCKNAPENHLGMERGDGHHVLPVD